MESFNWKRVDCPFGELCIVDAPDGVHVAGIDLARILEFKYPSQTVGEYAAGPFVRTRAPGHPSVNTRFISQADARRLIAASDVPADRASQITDWLDEHIFYVASESETSDDTGDSEVMPLDFRGYKIRAKVDESGQPWFVAPDLAKVLGYQDARHMTRSLDDEDKCLQIWRTPGGPKNMTMVSESGFYTVVLTRRAQAKTDPQVLAQIKDFQHWVTREVLPTIRKTGSYQVSPGHQDGGVDEATRQLDGALRETDCANRTLQARLERLTKLVDARKRFNDLSTQVGELSTQLSSLSGSAPKSNADWCLPDGLVSMLDRVVSITPQWVPDPDGAGQKLECMLVHCKDGRDLFWQPFPSEAGVVTDDFRWCF